MSAPLLAVDNVGMKFVGFIALQGVTTGNAAPGTFKEPYPEPCTQLNARYVETPTIGGSR